MKFAARLLRVPLVPAPSWTVTRWPVCRFSWFDAHLWPLAERFGPDPLCTEDFEIGRIYATVRIESPFL